ncbi:hypothetical protein ACFWBF_31415 [Streptomyces sp. NPDC060028]|uniref:hypothetical protein n=1 Tax=Streptomyces sp. NPDC060028 TaxID=3347041 RepID=UPI003689DF98
MGAGLCECCDARTPEHAGAAGRRAGVPAGADLMPQFQALQRQAQPTPAPVLARAGRSGADRARTRAGRARGLDISAEAARSRFGRMRTSPTAAQGR